MELYLHSTTCFHSLHMDNIKLKFRAPLTSLERPGRQYWEILTGVVENCLAVNTAAQCSDIRVVCMALGWIRRSNFDEN